MRNAWLGVVWLLQACFVVAHDGAEPAGDELARDEPQVGQVGSESPEPESCDGDGSLDLEIAGAGLHAYEGRRAVVSAIEPQAEGDDVWITRPVLATTTIVAGAFRVSCKGALEVTNWYPSWAVFIDADADGRCGDADLGMQWQLYAWSESQRGALGPEMFSPIAGSDLWAPIGSDAVAGFCNGYFD